MKERKILKDCLDILKKYQLPFVRLYAGGIPVPVGQGLFTVRPNIHAEGISDLLTWLPEGQIVFIETKTVKGSLRETQKLFKKRCEETGAIYWLIRTATELEQAMHRIHIDNSRTILPDYKLTKDILKPYL